MANLQDPAIGRFLSAGETVSAYLWPEVDAAQMARGIRPDDDVFVFQFWPETLDDSYQVNYDDKQIPGGSHPIVQWTGGSGREISFVSVFVSEIQPETAAGSYRAVAATSLLTPSSRYTVDIRAAVAKLQSYLRPNYTSIAGSANRCATAPPPRLYLMLDNTRLGGDRDEVLVIMRSAAINYQAWFPNGFPRAAEVALSFSEVVQKMGKAGSGLASIEYVGRDRFVKGGQSYTYRGSVDRIIGA